jgi:hypothetical protein
MPKELPQHTDYTEQRQNTKAITGMYTTGTKKFYSPEEELERRIALKGFSYRQLIFNTEHIEEKEVIFEAV